MITVRPTMASTTLLTGIRSAWPCCGPCCGPCSAVLRAVLRGVLWLADPAGTLLAGHPAAVPHRSPSVNRVNTVDTSEEPARCQRR